MRNRIVGGGEADGTVTVPVSDPQGGALTLPYGEFVNVAIADDDGAPPTNPTPPTSASGNGGGGSLSWASLLIVSGLLLGVGVTRAGVAHGTCA